MGQKCWLQECVYLYKLLINKLNLVKQPEKIVNDYFQLIVKLFAQINNTIYHKCVCVCVCLQIQPIILGLLTDLFLSSFITTTAKKKKKMASHDSRAIIWPECGLFSLAQQLMPKFIVYNYIEGGFKGTMTLGEKQIVFLRSNIGFD